MKKVLGRLLQVARERGRFNCTRFRKVDTVTLSKDEGTQVTKTPIYDAVKSEQGFDPGEVDTRPLDYRRLCEIAGIEPNFPPLHVPGQISLRQLAEVPEQRHGS